MILSSVAAIAVLVFAQFVRAKCKHRTRVGWQIDHVLAYCVVTSIVCLAWPRPFVVGTALMAVSALLEWLQRFTPDRKRSFLAAFCGAGGALAAAALRVGFGYYNVPS